MRILFVNNIIPRHGETGGEGRMLEILRALSRHHHVTVYSPTPPAAAKQGPGDRDRVLALGVREVVEGFWNLGRLLAQKRFDLLFCEFWEMAEEMIPPFRAANPHSSVVVDSVDLHYVREEAAVKIGQCTFERAQNTRRRELAVYNEADLVVTVTTDDDKILREVLPDTPTVIIPIIVPCAPRPRLQRAKKLFFVANFHHLPNADGITWFAKEIWPTVKSAVPDAALEVAGREPPPAVKSLAAIPGIAVIGWIPETAPYLDQAALSIAPLRYGGGMKVKVTEALARGVPVVTTSFGVQGFGGKSGEHYCVADDPQGFAAAVIHLLQDPVAAEAMAARGQNLVQNLCSPEAVGRIVETLPAGVKLKSRRRSLGSRFRFQMGAAIEILGQKFVRFGETCMNRSHRLSGSS